MTGRLIGIVGPSGVGKDSVMHRLVSAVPDLSLVKRTITRAPGLGGEDYEAVLEQEFDMRAAAGEFCLHWEAHGLFYGIPDTVRTRVARGEELLVNLSRAILPKAQEVFPDLLTFNITAKPETLANRLAGRGRESEAEIVKRLERAKKPLPAGAKVINLSNDGPIEETIDAAIAVLYPKKVPL
ncbi:MAG: phosphonate metabolism protein/1,5-bisphosphokinase (PRPP-forming) PhnN [Cognatishimia sp.]|uniref:phosphonate metabolism protein/1,5-bisphosphokinase (PRPP-forming) PhnN n=1 Tax=Cognatishimia sp. TaxID=2211648 RepID=UPI003B8D1975